MNLCSHLHLSNLVYYLSHKYFFFVFVTDTNISFDEFNYKEVQCIHTTKKSIFFSVVRKVQVFMNSNI